MKFHRHIANRIATLVSRMFGGEAGSGVVLMLVAAAAMLIANSPWAHGYHAFFHTPFGPAMLPSLHGWINDGLMAVFFFVVGLEIKREVLDGELSSPAKRKLPLLAAFAGMVVPAFIYIAIAGTALPLARGWAIPAATDIAFALGVLALLGKGLPPSLRLFLLSVAIADDLGAVIIIAVFYTAKVQLIWLAASASVLATMALLNRCAVMRGWPYAWLALILWFCVLNTGIHATIAGVLAALTIPLRLDKQGDSLLLRMEHALVPWNGFLIVPLFGFANAGVALAGVGAQGLLAPLPMAIAAGLVLGKQIGIFSAIWASDRLGFAEKPAGASWLQIWGIALLCGIGFTMSLFIGALAFPAHPDLIDEAKLGVLAGSLISAVLGYAVLRLSKR